MEVFKGVLWDTVKIAIQATDFTNTFVCLELIVIVSVTSL